MNAPGILAELGMLSFASGNELTTLADSRETYENVHLAPSHATSRGGYGAVWY